MNKDVSKRLELLKRGTVEIFNEGELAEKLTESAETGRQLRIKLGLDPTSPDIHLGHTVVLRKMRQFQDLGHKAVLIIGDYTARIGDPSGQDTARPMLSPEQIEQNAKTYFEQASKILDTSEDKLEIQYNSKWLEKLTLTEVIHLAAKKTVAQMLQRDSFKLRLQAEQDVYTHEFLYPLMQGYDSVMVKSDVELGGTDQTFNNLVGRDIQRAYGQSAQIVITMPILVGLDGKEKMSKSKGNYIGVTDEPNDMFGKVMSISDDMMENYFTLLTDLAAEKITELTDPDKTHPKEAKVLLGRTIVKQFHDESAAQDAAAQFEKVFAQGQLPDEIPEVELPRGTMSAGKLLLACQLLSTSGACKRMIRQSAMITTDLMKPILEFDKRMNEQMKPARKVFRQIRKETKRIHDQIKAQMGPVQEVQRQIQEQMENLRDQIDFATKSPAALKQFLGLSEAITKDDEQDLSTAKDIISAINVRVNGVRVVDPNEEITPTDGMIVQVGKRKFARIRLRGSMGDG